MSSASHPDDSVVQQILEERARILAQPLPQADKAPSEEYVVFRLGDTCYGLPARSVKEAYPMARYTPLPQTPPFLLGLVNVRGRLLAALDLRPLLDLAPAPPQPNALLLIVGLKTTEVALLTDAVIDVRRISGDVAPTPSSMGGYGTAWLLGVDRSFALLIDPALLLADPRLIINTPT